MQALSFDVQAAKIKETTSVTHDKLLRCVSQKIKPVIRIQRGKALEGVARKLHRYRKVI
jgi:hypothetical protein